MTDSVIPDDARQFLLKSIDSIAQWEGLLLLRAHDGQGLAAVEIARDLYISEAETVALLTPLVEHRILMAEDGRYIYQPESAELDALIGRVADLYRQYLIPVTQFIHAKPAKSRVQAFADAFRIRKD